MCGPDYIGARQILRRENIISFDINDKEVQEKIFNEAERFGYSVEEYLKLLKENPVVYKFVKEPGRQGIDEKLAADYLNKGLKEINEQGKNDFLCTELKTLPKSGPYAKIISGGFIQSYDKDIGTKTKTIDFCFEIIGNSITISVYILHKYTESDGGAQDNQFKDVIYYLSECQNASSKKDMLFLALLDGHYYEKKYKNFEKNRIVYLNKQYGKENIKICTTGDLIEGGILLEYINRIFKERINT